MNFRLLYKQRVFRLNYNFIFLVMMISIVAFFCYAWLGMHHSFINSTSVVTISLNPMHLPYYSLRTVLRLLIGMVYSLIFALVAGYMCAKNKHISRVLLPVINFMESAPLLRFLTFTTAFFLILFPRSMMGLEAAAIFGVFTSQAWNMALVVYQTIRIVPQDVLLSAKAYKLNAWQLFWKVEMPYSIPGLLWNTMVSQSAAWFALVATEAIPVGGKDIMLPGVGSYISVALSDANIKAILYALIRIVACVITFDQLVFRPLVIWSKKFKCEQINIVSNQSSYIYDLCLKSSVFIYFIDFCKLTSFYFMHMPTIIARALCLTTIELNHYIKVLCVWCWYFFYFCI